MFNNINKIIVTWKEIKKKIYIKVMHHEVKLFLIYTFKDLSHVSIITTCKFLFPFMLSRILEHEILKAAVLSFLKIFFYYFFQLFLS